MTKLDRLRESNPAEVMDGWATSEDGVEVFTSILASTQSVEVLPHGSATAQRSPWVYLVAGFATALLIAVPATVLIVGGGSGGPLSPPQPTSARVVDEILSDGVVTFSELTTAAGAVISCVRENGGDLEEKANVVVEADGSLSFFMLEADSALVDRCVQTIFDGVSRVWARQSQPPRAESFYFYGGAVACTERRSGTDFGEMTRDLMGFVSTVGQRTIDAAIDAEPEIYDSCFALMLDQIEIYNQVLSCVAARSGASLPTLTGTNRSDPSDRQVSNLDEASFAILDDALERFPDDFSQCLGDITAQASVEPADQ